MVRQIDDLGEKQAEVNQFLFELNKNRNLGTYQCLRHQLGLGIRVLRI